MGKKCSKCCCCRNDKDKDIPVDIHNNDSIIIKYNDPFFM